MNAINWLRNKATEAAPETMIVGAEEGRTNGVKPGVWLIKRKHFKGVLPYRMAAQIRNELKSSPLVNTSEGNIQISERVQIGGQYRSDFGKCEFWHTVYELQGA